MEHVDIITEVTTAALQMGTYSLEDIQEDVMESLREALDSSLIYDYDILEYWDGDTHPEVDYNGDIMNAIRQSVFYQLYDAHLEHMDDYIGEAVEEYATEHFPHWPNLDWSPDAEMLLNFIASGGKDYGQN